MKRTPLTILLTLAAILWRGAALAQPADFRNILSGYSLTSWVQKDGLPPPGVIWALAQDSAGYLWLGTETGPLVFDGVQFTQWRSSDGKSLPRAAVRALLATRDASVWLGFDEPGGVSRIHDGSVRHFGIEQGLARSPVTALYEQPDGSLWAGTRDGLYRLSGDVWKASGKGLPSATIHEIHTDRVGRLLVATAVGTFYRNQGEERFHALGRTQTVRGIAESPSGIVWVADSATGFRELRRDDAVRPTGEKGNGSRLLYDSKGNLWVGTFGQGLWRVPVAETAAPIQRTTTITGLSADGVMALLEDRDGNIWVATNDGLNRFTPHRVTPVLNLGVINGLEATPDGSLWVGSINALLEFPNGAVRLRRELRHFDGTAPSAMHVGEDGTLWVATSREVLRFVNRRWSVVPMSGLGSRQLSSITSMTSDANGGVWLFDRVHGLFHWKDGRLAPAALPPSLQHAQIVCSLTDRSGVIWFSFADGQVATLAGGGDVRVYGSADGLDVDVFRAIYEDRAGVLWFGGNDGLTWRTNGRFGTLGAANGLPPGNVISIIQDDIGVFWVGLEGSGIVRIEKHEFEKTLADPSYQIQSAFFDKIDGFAGAPRWFGNSTVARSNDGRLWYLSGRGVTIVDPRILPEGPGAIGGVRIDGVVAAGQAVAVGSQTLSLSQGEQLEIQYSVPNLTYPLRTRFRYRLEGLDSDWIEAGTARRAIYTNLPPRPYRFRVQATNNESTWPESGVVWEFSIPPKFYQTTWFLAIAVLGLVLSVGGMWRLHLRGVRKQFLVLLGERARLSREIHDTVLQGLCGIGLQCDVIAHDATLTAPAMRERLLRLRNQAEEYAREARRSIMDLRSPKTKRSDLAEALRQSGERVIGGGNVRLKVTVNGAPFENATADEHLVRIGREALTNAIHHGQASEVRMDLQYGETSLLLKVSDNGDGFDADAVQEPEGHCGLTSMKERAEAVGGTLRIRSTRGRGTDVEARVPKHPTA